MATYWIGTSGYSYKQWKGRFYPEALPDAEMLRYYATRFAGVEINYTFRRFPTEKSLTALRAARAMGASTVLTRQGEAVVCVAWRELGASAAAQRSGGPRAEGRPRREAPAGLGAFESAPCYREFSERRRNEGP